MGGSSGGAREDGTRIGMKYSLLLYLHIPFKIFLVSSFHDPDLC